ncbi:MAG: tetratricopeptide repeat protein, partial [Kiritimatiellae bacterium]|nr:tetratricopeptide repeat protein [Kiritimatiellia bacterium]
MLETDVRSWSRVCVVWALLFGMLLLGALGGTTRADSIESIFLVDGMAVDKLDDVDEIESDDVFQGGLPRFPLVEKRKRYGRFTALLQQEPTAPQSMLPQSGVQEKLAQAERYIDKGEWNQARRSIEEALESSPDSLYLLRRAAALSAAAGKFGVADGYFRRSVEADPENVPYLIGWAGVLIRLYRFDEAQVLVDKAMTIDPKYLAARFNQAILRIVRNDLAGLEREWEAATLNEVEEVAGWLTAHREDLGPVMSEEAYTLLCDVVMGLGTQARLEKIRSTVRAAYIAGRQSKWDEALRLYAELEKHGVRSYSPRMHMAIAFSESGDNARALEILDELVQRYPDDDSLLYNLGFLLLRDEKYERAMTVFETLHQRAPESGDFAFALACSYVALGRMDDAWPLLTQLAQNFPQKM